MSAPRRSPFLTSTERTAPFLIDFELTEFFVTASTASAAPERATNRATEAITRAGDGLLTDARNMARSVDPTADSRAARGCDDCAMRTAVISDLHLGLGSGADLLRRERFREPLLERLEGVDRLVLLGDVLELRDRPLAEVLEVAAPGARRARRAARRRRGGDRPRQPRPPPDRAVARAPRAQRRRRRSSSSSSGSPEGLAFEALAGSMRRGRGPLRLSRASGCATTSTPPTATTSTAT